MNRNGMVLGAFVALALMVSFTSCDFFSNPDSDRDRDPDSKDTPEIRVPMPPGDIVVTTESTNSITISWKSVYGADGYNIYRSPSYITGPYSNKIGTTTSTAYTDTDLSANTTYYYKVSAFNSKGESSQSLAKDAMTYPEAPTMAPTGITASGQSSSSILIRWEFVTGISSEQYIVYRSFTETGDFTEINRDWSSSYTDTGLETETTYYYKVAVSNISGTSPLSGAVPGTTLDKFPRAPSSVLAYEVSYSGIMINWSYGANADEYNVYRSSSASGDYSFVEKSSSTTYTDRGLNANTSYYYRVSGVNIHGESELSTKYSFAKTLVSGAGTNKDNAIEFSSIKTAIGDFPDSRNEMWYKFRNNGAATIYASDKKDTNSSYTGDIMVDVMIYENNSYLAIDNKVLHDIDIGKGPNDPNNIYATNWNSKSYGDYYVRVKPLNGTSSNKGTFELRFRYY
jgi:fibronectin type 3 domain-containing protein